MNEISKLKETLRTQLLAARVAIVCVDFEKPKSGILTVQEVGYTNTNGGNMTVISGELDNEVRQLFIPIAKQYAHTSDGGSLVWDIESDDLRIDVFTKVYKELGGWDAVLAETKTSDSDSNNLVNPGQPIKSKTESSVLVKHWGAYGVDATVMTHQLDIDDQRSGNGKAYVTLGAIEGNLDDMLSVTMEVNTNPLNGIDQVPCAHVHFDNDALAVSLFKIGDKILMRPESFVSIERVPLEVGDFAETMFWLN